VPFGLKSVVGIAAVVVVVVAVAIVFVFAGGDDEVEAPVPTTSGPTTTPSDDDVVVTIICLTPREAVENLVDSWLAGSQAAAGRCASGVLVELLFDTDIPRAGWVFQSCQDPPTPVTCSYRYRDGVARFTVLGEEDAGFVVDDLDLDPD
jgi:hypothetical protein